MVATIALGNRRGSGRVMSRFVKFSLCSQLWLTMRPAGQQTTHLGYSCIWNLKGHSNNFDHDCSSPVVSVWLVPWCCVSAGLPWILAIMGCFTLGDPYPSPASLVYVFVTNPVWFVFGLARQSSSLIVISNCAVFYCWQESHHTGTPVSFSCRFLHSLVQKMPRTSDMSSVRHSTQQSTEARCFSGSQSQVKVNKIMEK